MLNDNEPEGPAPGLFAVLSEIAGSRAYPLALASVALSLLPLILTYWLGIFHPLFVVVGAGCALAATVLFAVAFYRAYFGGGRGDRD